jgi:hypothetical protein
MSASLRSRPNLRTAAIRRDVPEADSCTAAKNERSCTAQIIFVLLELMISPMKELRHRWASVAYVILPSLILSPLWVFAVSAAVNVGVNSYEVSYLVRTAKWWNDESDR